MITYEFSNEFDTLVNSYASREQFGNQPSYTSVVFDEYEKSVFLTKGQEDLVKDIYTGRYTGESFEATEKVRRELESLVTQYEYVPSITPAPPTPVTEVKLSDSKFIHILYTLPEDLLYIVYELVQYGGEDPCINTLIADVYPVTHDEYWRVRNNPFRGPNKRRVLRLDKGNELVELVSALSISKYTIRYLKKPPPIILTSLQKEGLSINNVDTVSECILPETLHRDILERAVRLALASKSIAPNRDSKGES